MILPIVAYGHPALREENQEVGPDYPELQGLIDQMFETMYNAHGVGLAAPQVGVNIQLFIVDGTGMNDLRENDEPPLTDFKMAFINPEILEETGDEYTFEEGCLSIPFIREDVTRPEQLTIRYQDRDFNLHTETFSGIRARIIQHEFDHIEGVLFTDYITGLRKQLLKSKLAKISKGKVSADYPMTLPVKKSK